MFNPALTALIRELTIVDGGTRRSRIAMSSKMLTCAPEKVAATQRPTGTK